MFFGLYLFLRSSLFFIFVFFLFILFIYFYLFIFIYLFFFFFFWRGANKLKMVTVKIGVKTLKINIYEQGGVILNNHILHFSLKIISEFVFVGFFFSNFHIFSFAITSP